MENTTETIKGKSIFFNFIEIDVAALNNETQYDYIQQLITNKLHGIVFRNILSQNEIRLLLSAVKSKSETSFNDVIFGKIFPMPFAIMNDDIGVKTYFESQENFNTFISNNNLDFLNKSLISLFTKISSSIKLSVLQDQFEQKNYSIATLRKFSPNKGGLHIHCGHGHHEVPFYKRLPQKIALTPQLSFFIVLQNTEEGGELTIYDLLWEKGQHKDAEDNNKYILNSNEQKIFIDTKDKFQVRPKAGDILVFAGGEIYHRVEQIHGASERITYGGFINFSKDLKEFYLWS